MYKINILIIALIIIFHNTYFAAEIVDLGCSSNNMLFKLKPDLNLKVNNRYKIIEGLKSHNVKIPIFQNRIDNLTPSDQNIPVFYQYVGGLIGASLGFLGGGFIGAAVMKNIGNFETVGYEILVPAMTGEILLSTAAVYLINKKQGNLLYDYITSTTIGLLGMIALKNVDSKSFGPTLLALPLIQVGATVSIDRIF